jgi:endonuclease G
MARRLPAFLAAANEGTGNNLAEYTDSLGLTGHDVYVATPEGFTPAAPPFLGAPPRVHPTNDVPALAALVPLNKTGFSIAYSPTHRHPYWVAYMLNPVDSFDTPPRPSNFKSDPAVKSPRHDDYTGSGYDRGHMAPNLAIASRHGRDAQIQTFLTSNICPQRPALNRGPWRDIEHRVAKIYGQQHPVWVIIGVIPPDPGTPTLENNSGKSTGISIPSAFYSIILSVHGDRLRVCAMIVPQDAPINAHPRQYLSSVREIETLTGLDFFSDLPPGQQELLKLPTATRLWPAGAEGSWAVFKDRIETRAQRMPR